MCHTVDTLHVRTVPAYVYIIIRTEMGVHVEIVVLVIVSNANCVKCIFTLVLQPSVHVYFCIQFGIK